MPALRSHYSVGGKMVPGLFIARTIADMLGGAAIFGWRNQEGGGDNEEESKKECQREGKTRERGRQTERGREIEIEIEIESESENESGLRYYTVATIHRHQNTVLL